MRFLSVCSGMEAASVAWEPLGWKAVGFSEIEPFPCAILKHRFPNTPNYGSLTEYQSWPIEPGSIDLLVGGTPCQSFSVAGLRKGLADPRGNLALTFLGLADKLRPRWIVWENVPGVLSSGGGRDFGSFLGALEQLGYGWAYRVLDAQYFGVPQRRRRVFVVASLGCRDVAASVLLKPESLCWHPAKGRKKGQATAPDAGSGVEAGSPIGVDFRHERFERDGTVGTIQSKSTGGYSLNYAPGVAIPFRKSKRACSTTDNETWVEADASNTLNNFDLGDTRKTHAVVEPQLYENRPTDSRITGPHNVSPTMTSRFGTGGGNIPLVQHHMPGNVAPTVTSSGPPYSRTGNERVEAEALAITFQPGNLRREAGADPSTTTTTTLKASAGDQMPHVAVAFDGYNQTLSNTSQTIRADKSDGDHVGMVLQPMAVRRLTPNECYRLQGFPDNWGRIPWKGKPAEECPDGPQYKACGNSMAVPVMRWIGEQIARVELLHNQPTNNNA